LILAFTTSKCEIFNPRILDFGMAKIFGRDEVEAKTRKVVGI
jgi:hypothetical protein